MAFPSCTAAIFLGSAEFDTYNQTRLLLGIHPGNFQYRLEPDETFCSPEVAMTYSNKGLEHHVPYLSQGLPQQPVPGQIQKSPPSCPVKQLEGVYFDFNGEKLLQMARDAASMGIELFVMDDGWFGKT